MVGDRDKLRAALGRQILKIAEAMHAIEWNDSGDGHPNEEGTIRTALGKDADVLKMGEIRESIAALIAQLPPESRRGKKGND